MEKSPDPDPPRPALRWYQFRLSSLIAAQLVAAGLIYLNVSCSHGEAEMRMDVSPISYTGDAWGFPFPLLWGKEWAEGYTKNIIMVGFAADVLIWLTLVLGTLVGLEIYFRAGLIGFMRFVPSRETFDVALVIAFVEGLLACLNARHDGLGWPWVFFYTTIMSSLTPDPQSFFAPELVLDLFVNGALILIPCVLYERWRRRKSALV